MKKVLLVLAATALMVTSAHGQSTRNENPVEPITPQMILCQPEVKMEVAQMRLPGSPVMKASSKASSYNLWYRRPAGAFVSTTIVEDGANVGMFYSPCCFFKPYTYYTFKSFISGFSENAIVEWDYQHDDGNGETWAWIPSLTDDLTVKYGIGIYEMPVLYVQDNEDWYMWTPQGYQMGGTTDKPTIVNTYPSYIYSIPDPMAMWEYDILKSSKSFVYGGRNGDKRYPMTYITGAEPWGDNEDGYWFGKNAGTGNYRIDGIAQAFEKPTAPYVLNYVAMDVTDLVVADGAQVEMTCKIYKLEDGIPPYMEDDEAVLPDEPGELIAKGRAIVTPETDATTGGLIFFTLYGEEDGLEYDITPTIDCAILVAIDGYNDPEMDGLQSFSAKISSDTDVDEGFGELAYLKFGIPDEDGNLDHYVWAGLNNFFTSGQMKTGLTIFLSTKLPFLTFCYDDAGEDGEYLFPVEGGLMEKTFGDHTCRSIEFRSWEPSANGDWRLSCNGKKVPSWLNITLEDQYKEDDYTTHVNAQVTAEPLPAGVKYREAVVRFEYPGAYMDYKFMQGERMGIIVDVDGDGAVTIGDINEVIDMILGDRFDAVGDCNGDGAVNIGDINALIAIILK